MDVWQKPTLAVRQADSHTLCVCVCVCVSVSNSSPQTMFSLPSSAHSPVFACAAFLQHILSPLHNVTRIVALDVLYLFELREVFHLDP